MWKVVTQELFEPNFISFHPVVLKKKTFKNFLFFNPSEVMVVILENGQGHPT
jgi:hypothetical protein